MSSSAFSVRVCASSKTMTSTSSKPRPNPASRAPNRIRDPLRNRTSCSPFTERGSSMNGLTFARLVSPFNFRNVSFDVLVRCAVHNTVRPGKIRHSATITEPTRKVLPTWRGIDSTIPPSVAAYLPSARLPSISRPRPCCQSSCRMPRSRHLSRTAGYPVVTIPVGTTTCRATSESFRVPCFVGTDGTLLRLLRGPEVERLDLLRDVLQPPSQSRKITRRAIRVLHRLRDPLPHRHQQIPVRARLGSLDHRLLPPRGLAGSNGTEGRLRGHATLLDRRW